MKNWIIFILKDSIIAMISALFVLLLQQIYINRKRLKLYVKTKWYWNEEVRVSISYLFKIKIDGKYLLVLSNNIPGQYQPVGGAYKVQQSFSTIKRKLNISPDRSIGAEDNIIDDLRVKIPSKNLLKLIDWFGCRTNREINVSREYYEELIKPGYIEECSLNGFNPEYIDTYYKDLKYSKYVKMKEIIIYDIFLTTLSKQDEISVKEYIKNEDTPKLVLVTEDEINRYSFKMKEKTYKIGEHTEYIMN